MVVVKSGGSASEAEAWSAAIEQAKSSGSAGPTLLKLHRLAAEAGLPEQAEQALVEAIRTGRGPLPLYADLKSLLASLQQKERENTLLEICSIYLTFEPGNPVLLTQYGYLSCLNNLADPATVLTTIELLAKAYPKEVPIQCVLAALYLCGGQPAKAGETLDPLELDPTQMPPAYRAIMLATRVLNEQVTADRKESRTP